MAGIRRVLEALRRETPVLTRQAEDYPVLRSRAAGDTPVDPTGIPISALPGADTPTDNDVFAIVQDDTTKKSRLGALLAWIKGQLSPSDIGAQGEILVSGLLKGNGVGGISAAQPGTDYGTYSKPNGGIPASDLANGVIPTVPSASTATPQMDGDPSPGSTGQWADGGHVHPTDTTRAAAALEINGHPLTGDFDLTAADVGALEDDGTAAAARTLASSHAISGPAGWYRFIELSCDAGQSRSVDLLINDSFSYQSGIVRIYISRTSTIDTVLVSLIAGTIPANSIRWEYTSTLSVYINKASTSEGYLQFRVLSSAARTGVPLDLDGRWASDAVSEPSTASNTIAGALNYQAVAVSAGANQQILQVLDNSITENHILAEISFADPAYITGGGSWSSAAGSFTLTGTATAATTADILLVRKGN